MGAGDLVSKGRSDHCPTLNQGCLSLNQGCLAPEPSGPTLNRVVHRNPIKFGQVPTTHHSPLTTHHSPLWEVVRAKVRLYSG